MQKRSRKYYVFYVSVGLNFESCQISCNWNTHLFIFFDFALEIFTQGPEYQILHVLPCFSHMIMNLWKKGLFFLFCGIKIANHRFLVKNILATLGKDDQEKGTDLWEKRTTRLPFAPWPFWKLFNTQSQWSGPFIIRMAAMSQILWVFPHVSYLGSAKVVQSQAKNWRQKSANPMLFPHMSRGSTPRDGCW